MVFNYQTSRVSSVIDFSAVDLKSNRFNCGLNIELSKEFSILSAVEKFTSSGYDLFQKEMFMMMFLILSVMMLI